MLLHSLVRNVVHRLILRQIWKIQSYKNLTTKCSCSYCTSTIQIIQKQPLLINGPKEASVSSVYDSATTPRPRDNPHVTCCVSSSLMIDIFHFILIANKHKIICAVPSGDEMTVIRECFTEQSARSCKRTAKESDKLHGFLQKILISFHRFFKLFVMNMFNND